MNFNKKSVARPFLHYLFSQQVCFCSKPSRGWFDETNKLIRVYKNVTVLPAPDSSGWMVSLDGKTLNTPKKTPMVLPTRSLAVAIAAEWAWQDKKKTQQFTMPLNTLASVAIDRPVNRSLILDNFARFLHSDPIIIRELSGPLARQQALKLDPIVDWVNKTLHVQLKVTSNLLLEQEKYVEEIVHGHFGSMDKWHLTAANFLSHSLKSVLLALAVMHGRLDSMEALSLSRLEEEFQIKRWGMVEGGHDIDVSDLKVRLIAPSLLVKLLKDDT
eukprot:TRINITY_DN3148_c0_g1_i6.p1 TRINITY_DN3148_c0_g1~~TRINITY_DN3148_c0_g1_i6.p1  ORF type:complete len:272 (-),score=44.00 TRINITY_DN3148_c0_g1_i6:100-915(-)